MKRNWIQYYEPGDEPVQFDFVVQSWDTASKKGELNSFSVATTWGCIRKTNQIYLLHVERAHLSYQELKTRADWLYVQYEPTKILIEDKASGVQLAQELPDLGIRCVETVNPKGDKIMRMHAQAGHFEGLKVRLPCKASWLDAYVHELTTFPHCRHSDQVDSTSQALLWITEKFRRRSFFDMDIASAPPMPHATGASMPPRRRILYPSLSRKRDSFPAR